MKKLVIFDCDGVLVDSEIIANRIEAAILTELGYAISPEENLKKFIGLDVATMTEVIFQETGIKLPVDFASYSNQLILETLKTELAPLMLPVLTHSLLQNRAKCIASNSPRNRVLRSLEITQQEHFFHPQHIFTAEQVKNKKPAPDLFLLAAQEMAYQPQDCLVIEDSIAGIQAARRAGMQVIGFLGGSHAQFAWYKSLIEEQQVPTADNIPALLNLIAFFFKRAHFSS